MESNLPVWGYYPKDDQYFIDPLYVPYMRKNMQSDGEVCEVNTWKKQGYPDGLVNPGLVRKGWGLGFQLLHPDKDPCPEGWTKGEDGWCVENKPEFGDNGLYSKDAFVAKYQYWDSYAPKAENGRYREINQFDQRSVHPQTGNYVVYHHSRPAEHRTKYGSLPSKDSLLV